MVTASRDRSVLFGIEEEFDAQRRSAPAWPDKIVIEVVSGRVPALPAGWSAAGFKDCRLKRITALLVSGQQAQLWGRKRRPVCPALCAGSTVTQTSEASRPRRASYAAASAAAGERDRRRKPGRVGGRPRIRRVLADRHTTAMK